MWNVLALAIMALASHIAPAAASANTSPGAPPPDASGCKSVTDVVNGRPDLQQLQELMATDSAALRAILDSEEITFFAPNNAAWEAAGPGVVAALQDDQAKLEALIIGHVAAGRYTAEELNGQIAGTLRDSTVTTDTSGPNTTAEISVTGIIVVPDLPACNSSIVHVVNKLLVRPDVSAGGSSGMSTAQRSGTSAAASTPVPVPSGAAPVTVSAVPSMAPAPAPATVPASAPASAPVGGMAPGRGSSNTRNVAATTASQQGSTPAADATPVSLNVLCCTVLAAAMLVAL